MTGNTSTQGSRSPYKNNCLSEPTSATILLYPVRVPQHLQPCPFRSVSSVSYGHGTRKGA